MDGGAVHLERPGEVAGRGEALALEVPAAADVADDRVRDRAVKGHANRRGGQGGVRRHPFHLRSWPRPTSNG